MKKADFLILLVILGLTLGLFGWQKTSSGGSGPLVAEIYLEGALYDSIPLAGEGRELAVESGQGRNVLHIGPNGVWMTEADCPSGECLHAAPITQSGQMISCLPHRLTVRLTGGEEAYDALAG